MPFADPALGTLSVLPLEIRWQIYDYNSVNDPYCFHTTASTSLFQNYYHDPYIAAGIARVSRSIWREIEELNQYNQSAHNKTLNILITATGWSSNHPPWFFREDWEHPDYSGFDAIRITVNPPTPGDTGQVMLIRRNISAFIAVLNKSPDLLPTTTIDVSGTTGRHPWTRMPRRGRANALSHIPDFDDKYLNLAPLLLPFLQLRNTTETHVRFPVDMPTLSGPRHLAHAISSLAGPKIEWPVVCASLSLGGTWRQMSFEWELSVRSLLDIDAIVLDRDLDSWGGRTAEQLRDDRAEHWGAYRAWFDKTYQAIRKRWMWERLEFCMVNRRVLMKMADWEWRHKLEVDCTGKCARCAPVAGVDECGEGAVEEEWVDELGGMDIGCSGVGGGWV
jgi:hypothetical protein